MAHSERVMRAEAELKAALIEEGWPAQEREREKARNETANTLRLAEAGSGVFGPEFDLDHIFKYHSPTSDQIAKYASIRDAAKYFAQVILDNAPISADRAAAIRKLRECVMTANASIALRGRL